jgi:8-oxo-dGTP pyrophosphatase MutT (NUDIX family)
MPIPEFVASLRSSVGHDRLLLPGVTAVVRNGEGQVLLGLRSDNGRWSLISGILEPGEQPAEALRREIREETGVEAEVTDLSSVWMMPEVTYPNGDVAQYLDLCFLARHVSGEPHVADDESLEVGWFAPDALPDGMTDTARRKLSWALAFDGRTHFER